MSSTVIVIAAFLLVMVVFAATIVLLILLLIAAVILLVILLVHPFVLLSCCYVDSFARPRQTIHGKKEAELYAHSKWPCVYDGI